MGYASGCSWAPLQRAWDAVRFSVATPEERGLCIGAAAATIAIVVHSVFVNSLMTPFVMEPLWVLWGLGFLVATSIRRRTILIRA